MNYDVIIREIDEAIHGVISKYDPCVLSKFVLVAETIDTDGDRGVWVLNGPDMLTWDTLGMLQYALNIESSANQLRRSGDE